jgi:hypothetical protein
MYFCISTSCTTIMVTRTILWSLDKTSITNVNIVCMCEQNLYLLLYLLSWETIHRIDDGCTRSTNTEIHMVCVRTIICRLLDFVFSLDLFLSGKINGYLSKETFLTACMPLKAKKLTKPVWNRTELCEVNLL